MSYLIYTSIETDYLAKKDPALGKAIKEIGEIKRELTGDLFTALVYQIISQQISTKGAKTVCKRLTELVGEISPKKIMQTRDEDIQKCGTSLRKASYIEALATSVTNKEINLDELPSLSDDEVCNELVKIKGIGVWTAEMLMTFSMNRPNIISYGDIAILRGMRMLYRHRKITPKLFNKYKNRYSPYATVASLYLWEIASGACGHLTDPAPPYSK